MSTASVSRSSSPFEIARVDRRSTERTGSGEVFTLPVRSAEEAQGPRPRLDEDRMAVRDERAQKTGREAEGTRDERSVATSGRRTESDETRTDEAGDAGKAAAGGTEASAGAGQSEGTEAGAGASAGGSAEARKAKLAAALTDAPVIGEATPEAAAAAGAAMQPPVAAAPAIGAEFLALAALAVQGGVPAAPEGGAAQDEGGAGQGQARHQGAQAAVLPAPTPPSLPAKADGSASAGGEAAAKDLAAGVVPQVPAGRLAELAAQGKAEAAGQSATASDMAAQDGKAAGPGEADKAGSGAAETKGQTAGAAGQAEKAAAGAPADDAAPAVQAQPGGAPLTPQAMLAAGPPTLTAPQAPLTELDAAAQATAHAQAEASLRTLTGEGGRPTPPHLVPVEIGAQALAGNRRFDIRLDPAELGRVNVSLEIGDDGSVSAKLTVDRVETLQLLQRDARTLEKAFEQAGLKPSDGGVEMSLRDRSDQSGAHQQRQDEEAPRTRRAWVEASEDAALAGDAAPRRAARLGGVDLSV